MSTENNRTSEYYLPILQRRMNRRKAISTAAKAAIVGGVAVAGAGGFFAYQQLTAPSAGPLPVGSILDATGPINIYGTPMIDSTQFTVDEINQKGGVLGRQLKLTLLDGQSDTRIYAEHARRLILQERVAVIHGGITSASREAVRPVIDENSGPVYFYNEQYEGGVCDKWVFNTGVTPAQQLIPLIDYAIAKYGSKFYTIAADYNYGQISAAWVKFLVKERGGQTLNEEFIPLDVSEFSSTLARIQAARPDVIMSLLVGGNHISYYQQHAAAGLRTALPIVSPTFGLGNEHIVLSPESAEGLTVIYAYFQELDSPTNRDFVRRWQARFGANYPYITDSANVVHIGWNLWKLAVEKAGTLDRDAVIAALESGLEFDAPEGRVRLDPQSHHVVHTMHLAQVNSNHGYKILQTFPNIPPRETQVVCDLIKNPNTHTQYTAPPS